MLKATEIIKKLRPCSWRYNKTLPLGDKLHFGFVAQDLLKDLGEDYGFVDTSGEFLKVNYQEFIGPIVHVLQEQTKLLAEYEKRIKYLEDKIKE